jgi:hypothetical protein
VLFRKTCEGRFDITIGSGTDNNELHAQRTRRRLYVWNGGLGLRRGGSCPDPQSFYLDAIEQRVVTGCAFCRQDQWERFAKQIDLHETASGR